MASKGITLPITYKADLGGLKDAEKGLENFGKAAAGISAAAVAAVTAIGVKGVQAFAEFDSKLNQSVAIMGDVSDALRNDMADAAREVAKTTTFSAAEAAESYFFLASAGLDAEASIAALPKVAAFAQAGMFDMATATDLLTDAQSALGLTSDDAAENLQNMADLSDVLVKANTLANASVEQFSEALTNKAAGSMRSLNIEMEEGVAVLAVFADQGIKGSQAGTTFNATIRGLTQGAMNNAEAFSRLGIEVFDADGAMNNMADIVSQMEGALGDLSVEQQRAELSALGFTEETLAGTLALIGNSDAIREYEAELRNAGGTVDDVAAKQLETFSGQLSLLQSGFEDTFLSIGALIVPILLEMMTSLGPVLETLSGSLVAVFEELVPVITLLAEAFIPLAEVISSNVDVIGDIARIFGEVLAAVMPTVTELLQMVAVVLWAVLDAAQPIIDKILPIMMGLFEDLMPVLWDLIENAILPLVDVAFEIIGAFLPLIEMILPILVDIIQTLAPVIINVVQAFLPLLQMILPPLIALMELLIPVLLIVVDIFLKQLSAAINWLLDVFKGFMAFLKPFTDMFMTSFGGLKTFFFGIVNGLIDMWEGFANGIIDGVNFVIRALNRIQVKAPAWLTTLTGITSFGISIPELSRIALPRVALAEGGIVTGPLNALIGEAGPEAVIPLDKLGNMGGNVYNITINSTVADARLGEVVVSAIKRYERVSGPVFASA
jgi:TP901 family phage tail tape measure protein